MLGLCKGKEGGIGFAVSTKGIQEGKRLARLATSPRPSSDIATTNSLCRGLQWKPDRQAKLEVEVR